MKTVTTDDHQPDPLKHWVVPSWAECSDFSMRVWELDPHADDVKEHVAEVTETETDPDEDCVYCEAAHHHNAWLVDTPQGRQRPS